MIAVHGSSIIVSLNDNCNETAAPIRAEMHIQLHFSATLIMIVDRMNLNGFLSGLARENRRV